MVEHPDDNEDTVPLEIEGKWPAWMVTLGVVTFCTAFWAGAYFIWDLVS